MTTNEISVGPLYLAREEAIKRFFRPHLASVSEMCEPYRTGKALILPTGFKHLFAVGFWTRDIYDDVLDFPNRWPKWMQSYEPDDDPQDPSWVKGAKFRPRALTEDELNEAEKEAEARRATES